MTEYFLDFDDNGIWFLVVFDRSSDWYDWLATDQQTEPDIDVARSMGADFDPTQMTFVAPKLWRKSETKPGYIQAFDADFAS